MPENLKFKCYGYVIGHNFEHSHFCYGQMINIQFNKLSNANAPPRILLITAERLGDTLFLTPGIRLLKTSLPAVQFDVLCFSTIAAAILANNPYISNILISKNRAQTKLIIRKYSQVINLMHEMLARIGTPPKNLLTIGAPNIQQPRALQVLEFIKFILDKPTEIGQFNYEIFPTELHDQTVKELLSQRKVYLEHHILIGLQLGCHRIARRGWKFWNRKRHEHKKVWLLENYILLAQKLLHADPNIKLILTGSANERFLSRMFLEKCPQAIDFTGETSVPQLASLTKYLNVLVTHDTGILHIASATKTPLVALFGPTFVSFTGPFPMLPQYQIISAENIADISVEQVYAAVIRLLDPPI